MKKKNPIAVKKLLNIEKFFVKISFFNGFDTSLAQFVS